MNHLLSMLLSGIGLGLGAAVPIGPVNVEIARRTLRGGFVQGFALGCGAVTVDIFYATLSSLGFAWLLDRPVFYWPLTISGILFLSYLGAVCWIGAIKAVRSGSNNENVGPIPSSLPGGYITGLLMTLLNPMTLFFWFVAVPSVVGKLSQQPKRDLPMICVGVFVGTISWVIGFAGTLAFAGRWRRSAWMFLADAFGGTTLLAFAAMATWKAMHRQG
jgi:L-lysine exporter family protein LysE/ArgO